MRVPWRLAAVCSTIVAFAGDAFASSHSRGPLNRVDLIEDPLIHTPSHRVHAHSNFDLLFTAQGRRVKLTLEPNYDILPEGATIQRLHEDGSLRDAELIDRDSHMIFKGSSWFQRSDGNWIHSGHGRIMMKRGGPKPLFSGSFTLAHEQYHIQKGSYYESTKHDLDALLDHDPEESMVVWKDQDIRSQSSHSELKRDVGEGVSCNSHNLGFNKNPEHPLFQDPRGMSGWAGTSFTSLFGKRQIEGGNGFPGSGNGGVTNLRSSIGNTNGCPSTRKVALVGIATDCSYTSEFDSEEAVRENVIDQINSASAVYEQTFNISLGLQNITVSPSNCPGTPNEATRWNQGCSNSVTITDRLNLFSDWRSRQRDTNSYWTLLTNCPTNTEVGLAWLGQLCVIDLNQNGGDSTSGANVVAKTSQEWQVIAHETGHTFGAVHDCDGSSCSNANTVASSTCCPRSTGECDANGQFIMNPSTVDGVTSFSPCTVGNICSAFLRNSVRSDCLSDNRNVRTFQGNQCGNGIVEDGEDCDCGGENGCSDNQCCDPGTCRFRSNAVCDDSNEDCCQSCQFASSGTVCRASTGDCDPEETCSGRNSTCPPDETRPDGDDCGDDLQCASGQCTSRNLQCKSLMGSYTTNNDTYACSSSGCTLSCASPQFGPNECYSMSQYFLDGTPCGGGGTCSNGRCAGSSVGGEIGSWISENKNIVIGVSAGVGGLILLAIVSCIVSRCRRKSKARKRQKLNSQVPSMASPQYPQRGSSQWPGHRSQQGWDGPHPNQQGWNSGQQQQHWPGQQQQGWNPGYGAHGSNSVRYA